MSVNVTPSGKIDAGILASFSNVKTDDLFGFLKEKDFPAVRKWVVENSDGDSHHLFRTIYDGALHSSHWSWCCCAVLIIAKYLYQSAFVADQEINTLACLTEIMVESDFK